MAAERLPDHPQSLDHMADCNRLAVLQRRREAMRGCHSGGSQGAAAGGSKLSFDNILMIGRYGMDGLRTGGFGFKENRYRRTWFDCARADSGGAPDFEMGG